jgi:hypothetical protein
MAKNNPRRWSLRSRFPLSYALMQDGRTLIIAQKGPRGWYWYGMTPEIRANTAGNPVAHLAIVRRRVRQFLKALEAQKI